MDAIISTAVEEICAEGSAGISIPKLWKNLRVPLATFGLELDSSVKEAIWRRLLDLPNFIFSLNGASLDNGDPSIPSAEQSETLGLKVAAADHVRDSFLGIYDIKAVNVEMTTLLKQVLERVALARSDGIAQSLLSKEFKMKENKLFYFLKKLECQGLIVRQPTILRTRETTADGDDETKDSSIVKTNLVYLCRYAKRLSSLQRLEIAKSDAVNADESHISGEHTCEELPKEDVHVKDYLPEMKAICDMLEEASGKVLVVSDIKRARGYRMTTGHRTWRNMCNRMKDACLVEEFPAKVNGKVVKCLRLLKTFNPKDFLSRPSNCGYEGDHAESLLQCSRRGQVNDQIVELPIEHCIFDMIVDAGPKGMTISEVSRRLGLSNKRTEARIYDMCWRMPKRFPMHMQFESHNRTKIYRVWTLENFERHSSCMGSSNQEVGVDNKVSEQCEMGFVPSGKASREDLQSGFSLQELCHELIDDGIVGCALHDPNVSQFPVECSKSVCPAADSQFQVHVLAEDAASSEMSLSVLPSPKDSFSLKPPGFTMDSALREQRILSKLKNEKFLLTAELYKWLEGLQNDKQTTMARKTLARSLQHLQQEGHCKCIQVSVPALTNCKRNRATEVILHPSVENLTTELLGLIHKRLRDFDMHNRGHGLSRLRTNEQDVTELEHVKRHNNHGVSEVQSGKIETMRTNGYVRARMVRAKLLHNFLWSYVSCLPDGEDDLSKDEHCCHSKHPYSSLKPFLLSSAIECMPLQLFLQVVGSEKKIEDLVERCKLGLKISDLPINEYKGLMDTLATGRLSRVIDILFRLKLIQLTAEGATVDATTFPHCASMHSLELNPYIEVPRCFFVYPPKWRYDFVLSDKEAVDSYWHTLEYCYMAADRESASHAFPGSDVPEVFLARSWTSVRVMTVEQRTLLLKLLENHEPNRKVPFRECVKISKELDLTLEQVLRVSYDMRQRHRRRSRRVEIPIQQELNLELQKSQSVLRKRKRCSRAAIGNEVHSVCRTEETNISRTSGEENMKGTQCFPITAEKHDIDLLEIQNDEILNCTDGFNKSRDEERFACMKQSLPRQKMKRRRSFPWNDVLDRKLIIIYVKYRAPLGAKFSRVDWSSIPDLPTDPDSCRRRMHKLNSNLTVRKAVLRLCNIVGGRYVKFMSKQIEDRMKINGSVAMDDCCSAQNWDDFEDPVVKMAVDNILRFKRMADLSCPKRIKSTYEMSMVNSFSTISGPHEYVHLGKDKEISLLASGNNLHPRLKFSASGGKCSDASKQVQESLSVANAVELFKLVFLSTSSAPEMRSLLTDTLNWFSEHDLTIAFNYLKENKLMEHGHGSQQIYLSQKFFHDSYSSPFPVDSGKRAAKFSSWILKEDKELMGNGIDLNLDLQCGEVVHLFALLSLGRLSISPGMPKDGTGEVDDPKSSTCEVSDNPKRIDDETSKQKVWWMKDGEPCNRREKGFPGIKLFLKRRLISPVETMVFQSDKDIDSSLLSHISSGHEDPFGTQFQNSSALVSDHASVMDLLTTSLNDESLWESMAAYAKRLLSSVSEREQRLISANIIKQVYNSVHQAGEQGLSVREISEIVTKHGIKLYKMILDALTNFQLIVKVNAYNQVRVVDASYKSKYFITVSPSPNQDHIADNSQQLNDICLRRLDNHQNIQASEINHGAIESCVRHEPVEVGIRSEMCRQKVSLVKIDVLGDSKSAPASDNHRYRPILPWINGDGSTNSTLYRGLVRRIYGISMQNPGILEEDLIGRMNVLNPQSCRQLLELMVLDKHIIRRRMYQTPSHEPPPILKGLLCQRENLMESGFREHYFANPMSTFLL